VITVRFELFGSIIIVFHLSIVDAAIDFDDEFVTGTVEVEDEVSDGMLVTEFEVVELAFFEGLPEDRFGGSEVFAESAGCCFDVGCGASDAGVGVGVGHERRL
jgi:hypothetical protein